MTTGPLSGIRILERANGAAAGYAGRMLAAMGAEVAIVEGPQGSDLRREPPFLAPGASALFAYLGGGKRSVVCDLDSAPGRAKFAELLKEADVLLDDTPVDERPALGLDPSRIAKEYPNLVFVSILPFGASGPRAGWSGYDINLQHAGGEGYLMPNGLAIEMFPDRSPVKIYGHFADFQGGTSAAICTIAALIARPSTGGQFVDVSIQDANISESSIPIERYAGENVIENRHGRSFRYGGVMECADGFIEILTLEQHQWEGLVKLVGGEEWAKGLEEPVERAKHGDMINQRLREWTKDKKIVDVVAQGQALNVPIAKFMSPAEVLADPHERARGFFTSAQIPGIGPVDQPIAPFKYSETPAGLQGGAPELGAHDGFSRAASPV